MWKAVSDLPLINLNVLRDSYRHGLENGHSAEVYEDEEYYSDEYECGDCCDCDCHYVECDHEGECDCEPVEHDHDHVHDHEHHHHDHDHEMDHKHDHEDDDHHHHHHHHGPAHHHHHHHDDDVDDDYEKYDLSHSHTFDGYADTLDAQNEAITVPNPYLPQNKMDSTANMTYQQALDAYRDERDQAAGGLDEIGGMLRSAGWNGGSVLGGVKDGEDEGVKKPLAEDPDRLVSVFNRTEGGGGHGLCWGRTKR